MDIHSSPCSASCGLRVTLKYTRKTANRCGTYCRTYPTIGGKSVYYSFGQNKEDARYKAPLESSTEITILRKNSDSDEKRPNRSHKSALHRGGKSFPMKEWTSIIWVDKDYLFEFTVDEDLCFVLNDSIGAINLKMKLVPVETPEEAREEKAEDSRMQVADKLEPRNEDAEERSTFKEQELRRSRRV